MLIKCFVFSLGRGQRLSDKAESHSQKAISSLINECPIGWRKMLERKMQAKGSKNEAAGPILQPVTCKIRSRHSTLCIQLPVWGWILCAFQAPSAAIFMAVVLSSPSLMGLLSGSLAERQLTIMPADPLRKVIKQELCSHTWQ